MIKEHALDQPLHVQYWIYLTNLAQGDLGESFQRGRPVVDIFAEKFLIKRALLQALEAPRSQAHVSTQKGRDGMTVSRHSEAAFETVIEEQLLQNGYVAIARGQADMIGIGRPFYAEPELAARFLAEAERPSATSTACESCNRCLVPQMLGMPGVCYNPEIHKIRKPRGPGERSSEPSSEPPKPIQKVA